MVAGSGADAAPYFRIFNPIVQGQKFDPNGATSDAGVQSLRNSIHASSMPPGKPHLRSSPQQASSWANHILIPLLIIARHGPQHWKDIKKLRLLSVQLLYTLRKLNSNLLRMSFKLLKTGAEYQFISQISNFSGVDFGAYLDLVGLSGKVRGKLP